MESWAVTLHYLVEHVLFKGSVSSLPHIASFRRVAACLNSLFG